MVPLMSTHFSIVRPRRSWTLLVGVVVSLVAFALSGSAQAEPIHPFQASAECNFNSLGVCEISTQIDRSKRLLIEFVTGTCGGLEKDTSIIDVHISTVVGGYPALHYFFVQSPPFPSYAQPHTISQQVRLYADAKSNINWFVRSSKASSIGSCLFSISGQAVTIPPTSILPPGVLTN
jgi:hypothetical protein